jgi:hypothetical protein
MASRLVKRGVFEEIEGGENDDLKFFKEIQSSLAQPKASCGSRVRCLRCDHDIAAVT